MMVVQNLTTVKCRPIFGSNDIWLKWCPLRLLRRVRNYENRHSDTENIMNVMDRIKKSNFIFPELIIESQQLSDNYPFKSS